MRLIDGDALVELLILKANFYRSSGDFARAEGINNALWSIAHAQTVGGWISVKEKLPEICVPVLFTGKNYYENWYLAQRGWYDGDEWHRDGDYKSFAEYVAYWMPLPSVEGLDET